MTPEQQFKLGDYKNALEYYAILMSTYLKRGYNLAQADGIIRTMWNRLPEEFKDTPDDRKPNHHP